MVNMPKFCILEVITISVEPNNLSITLKQIRDERGTSLRDFSEILGISHAYLNKLERGTDPRTGKPITPTIETIAKIADGLGIPMKKFMAMCGYFNPSYSAQEPFVPERLDFDTEISALIAQITPDTGVFIGDTEVDESTKEILRSKLRELLMEMHNTLNSREMD